METSCFRFCHRKEPTGLTYPRRNAGVHSPKATWPSLSSRPVPRILLLLCVSPRQHKNYSNLYMQVKLANRLGLPFLAVNGGHGTTSSLNTIQHGVFINLRALNHVRVSQDGHSALVGGGARTHEVINALAASGKVTGKGLVDRSCNCCVRLRTLSPEAMAFMLIPYSYNQRRLYWPHWPCFGWRLR